MGVRKFGTSKKLRINRPGSRSRRGETRKILLADIRCWLRKSLQLPGSDCPQSASKSRAKRKRRFDGYSYKHEYSNRAGDREA